MKEYNIKIRIVNKEDIVQYKNVKNIGCKDTTKINIQIKIVVNFCKITTKIS